MGLWQDEYGEGAGTGGDGVGVGVVSEGWHGREGASTWEGQRVGSGRFAMDGAKESCQDSSGQDSMWAGKEKDEVSDMIEGRRCARASWKDTREYVSFWSRVLRLGVRMSEIRRIDGIARKDSRSKVNDTRQVVINRARGLRLGGSNV